MVDGVSTGPPVLQEITGTHWVSRTFTFRFEVWSAETTLRHQILEQGLIADTHDEHARHWAAFCGNQMVAAARMCIHADQRESPDAAAFGQICLPVPIATINRLVVHPSARNLGMASKLCECRVEAARKDGARCVVGTPIGARIASLEKLGFRLAGTEWVPNYAESLVTHAMVLVF